MPVCTYAIKNVNATLTYLLIDIDIDIFQYTELGIHIVRIKTEYKETNKL